MRHPDFPLQPRTGPRAFIGQAWRELRKVWWPSRHAATVYVRAVVVFVVVVGLFVVALDLVFYR